VPKRKVDLDRIHLKKGLKVSDFLRFHPNLFFILAWAYRWCHANGIVFRLTSLWRPHGDGISKSTTHQEYRAFDISFRPQEGWTTDLIDWFEEDLRCEFGDVGALVWNEGELVSKPIVMKPDHGHIQVRP